MDALASHQPLLLVGEMCTIVTSPYKPPVSFARLPRSLARWLKDGGAAKLAHRILFYANSYIAGL